MEGRDRGRGEQGPQRPERQMPAPEDLAQQRRVPGEIHEKKLADVVIPGPEKAIRQGTNITITGVKTFLSAQLTAEKLAEAAKSATEKTQNTGLKKVIDAVTKNSGKIAKGGKYALGPAVYVATELAAHYLDTAMADTLNAVGDAHFNAARRAFVDVHNEQDPIGKATHRRTAEGALRDAYDLYEADLAARDGKVLPKTAQIEAHLRATETALLVAAVNRMDPHTQSAVETWAGNAKDHFDQYADLVTSAAENGKKLTYAGGTAAMVASAATLWLLTPVVGGVAKIRIDQHENRITELTHEREDFYEVYSLLVPPKELPPQERRELT